jgi:uncharacterized Zn ribbon protein
MPGETYQDHSGNELEGGDLIETLEPIQIAGTNETIPSGTQRRIVGFFPQTDRAEIDWQDRPIVVNTRKTKRVG